LQLHLSRPIRWPPPSHRLTSDFPPPARTLPRHSFAVSRQPGSGLLEHVPVCSVLGRLQRRDLQLPSAAALAKPRTFPGSGKRPHDRRETCDFQQVGIDRFRERRTLTGAAIDPRSCRYHFGKGPKAPIIGLIVGFKILRSRRKANLTNLSTPRAVGALRYA
jgi:hypothetical protein